MKINFLVIHHTAVSYTKNPDQLVATNNYHKQKWNSISKLGYYVGYHYEIAADGTYTQTRRTDESGIHVVGHNFDSIGIAMDGNFDLELPTEKQVNTLTNLLVELHAEFPKAQIVPHRKFANKTCYGKLLSDDWASNLILNIKKMTLNYVKTENGEQYLLDDTLKIALNIGDEEELKFLQSRGINSQPRAIADSILATYEIYPLSRKSRWQPVIKLLRDLAGQ